MRTPQPWDVPDGLFRSAEVSVSPTVLSTAVRRGALVRLIRDVYIHRSRYPDDPRQRHLQHAQARQILNPELVASHHTAALAHRLPLPDLGRALIAPPHFTLPPAPSRRSGTPRRVTLRPLTPAHVCTLPSGLRATTAARTAIDLAGHWDLPAGLIVVDAAALAKALTMVTADRLRGSLDEAIRSSTIAELQHAASVAANRLSVRRLRRALEHADPRRESPGESWSFGHFIDAGLPAPSMQPPIQVAGHVYYPDFGWEEFELFGEVDGAVKYGTSREPGAGFDRTLLAEAHRHHQIEDTGVRLIRWWVSDAFRRPRRMTAYVRSNLERRGWRG